MNHASDWHCWIIFRIDCVSVRWHSLPCNLCLEMLYDIRISRIWGGAIAHPGNRPFTVTLVKSPPVTAKIVEISGCIRELIFGSLLPHRLKYTCSAEWVMSAPSVHVYVLESLLNVSLIFFMCPLVFTRNPPHPHVRTMFDFNRSI